MTEAETLDLWNRCEAARAEAKTAGVDDDAAHAAATAIFKAWSESFPQNANSGERSDLAAFRFPAQHSISSFDVRRWVFPGIVSLNGAIFRDAHFDNSEFLGEVEFIGAKFGKQANFRGVTFQSFVNFESATFSGHAMFQNAKFLAINTNYVARFDHTNFNGAAVFNGSQFRGNSNFFETRFSMQAHFQSESSVPVKFEGDASFFGAEFQRPCFFNACEFAAVADFGAISCSHAFSLRDVKFARVPNFIQASFREPPRLDDCVIAETTIKPTKWLLQVMTADDRDETARWQWMKRLASYAQDGDRELDFFAREIRSKRWVTDWPLPFRQVFPPNADNTRPDWQRVPLSFLPNLKSINRKSCASCARFWAGVLYALLSDYGRSILRPLAFFAAILALSTGLYLAEHSDISAARAKATFAEQTFRWRLNPTLDVAKVLWASLPFVGSGADQAPKCMTGVDITAETPAKPVPGITGLNPDVRKTTNAGSEALRLAFQNATIFGGGAESAHRMYGCLYGIDRFKDNPVPNVPASVSTIAAWQKLFSALMIFLFGLGVRNMLKMK